MKEWRINRHILRPDPVTDLATDELPTKYESDEWLLCLFIQPTVPALLLGRSRKRSQDLSLALTSSQTRATAIVSSVFPWITVSLFFVAP